MCQEYATTYTVQRERYKSVSLLITVLTALLDLYLEKTYLRKKSLDAHSEAQEVYCTPELTLNGNFSINLQVHGVSNSCSRKRGLHITIILSL